MYKAKLGAVIELSENNREAISIIEELKQRGELGNLVKMLLLEYIDNPKRFDDLNPRLEKIKVAEIASKVRKDNIEHIKEVEDKLDKLTSLAVKLTATNKITDKVGLKASEESVRRLAEIGTHLVDRLKGRLCIGNVPHKNLKINEIAEDVVDYIEENIYEEQKFIYGNIELLTIPKYKEVEVVSPKVKEEQPYKVENTNVESKTDNAKVSEDVKVVENTNQNNDVTSNEGINKNEEVKSNYSLTDDELSFIDSFLGI